MDLHRAKSDVFLRYVYCIDLHRAKSVLARDKDRERERERERERVCRMDLEKPTTACLLAT